MNKENNKRKTVRSTTAQINALIEYMVANPLFAAGEYSAPLGAQRLEAEWTALAESLANLGPRKTVAQWKHTWRDLKKEAREAGAQVRVARQATGQKNVPVPELALPHRRILDVLGHESATGIAVGEETGLGDLDAIPPPPTYVEVEIVEESTSDPAAGLNDAAVTSAAAAQARPRSRRTRRPQQSNAELFIKTQAETNKILQKIQSDLAASNQLRERQLELLQAIANKLDRSGH